MSDVSLTDFVESKKGRFNNNNIGLFLWTCLRTGGHFRRIILISKVDILHFFSFQIRLALNGPPYNVIPD